MNKEIFISYSWGDDSEIGESREYIVDRIYETLKSLNWNIVRDKKDVNYRGNIREFEQRLGAGDFIIMVVSDKFLKSKHCMYEALMISIWPDMYKRVFPIVLSDARIYNKQDVMQYHNYWSKKINSLQEEIRQGDSLVDITCIVEELRIFSEIRRMIDGFADTLANMNTLSPEIHKETNFSVLRQALEEAMKATEDQVGKTQGGGHNQSLVINNNGKGDVMVNGDKYVTNNNIKV